MMKHLKLFEAKKKTEDPIYHLADAMKDYLSDFLAKSNTPGTFQTVVKYFYSSARIMNKTNTLNYISIIKCESTTLKYFNILLNSDCRSLFDEILDKYKLNTFTDADRFSYVDVENIINDIRMKIAANKYNI